MTCAAAIGEELLTIPGASQASFDWSGRIARVRLCLGSPGDRSDGRRLRVSSWLAGGDGTSRARRNPPRRRRRRCGACGPRLIHEQCCRLLFP